MPTIKQAPTDQEGDNNTTTNVGDTTSNTNNNKRKNVSLATKTNDTKNVIQKVHSGDASTHRPQCPSDEDDSSSLGDSSNKEISVIDILFPCEGPELAEETLRALASKQGWRFGIGQRNIKVIQRALLDHYDKLVDGVDKLQEDIAAANNGAYSSDSDTDSDDDELEEINTKSLVAAEVAAEEVNDGDFSFDNDDGDESTNGTTDGLDTASADVPLHDNATQSSTTTTTLKLDSSCVENGMEVARGGFSFDNSGDESTGDGLSDGLNELGTGTPAPQHNNEPPTNDGNGVKDNEGNGGNGAKGNESNGVVEDNRKEPSPTNVEADLSGYNNDDINAKECVGNNNNTSTTVMSTLQTIQASPSSAFTANLRNESELYEDLARSSYGMPLPQFQQQYQLPLPPPQYSDRATLESMSVEELFLRYQQQQWQQQQLPQYYDRATLESMSDKELFLRYQQQQWQQQQQRQYQQIQQQMQYRKSRQQRQQFVHQQQMAQKQQLVNPSAEENLLEEERKKAAEAAAEVAASSDTSHAAAAVGNNQVASLDMNEELSTKDAYYKKIRDGPLKKCGKCGVEKKKWSYINAEWVKLEDGERICQVCTKQAEGKSTLHRLRIVIPSPPELMEEFEEFLDGNPKKKDEWEASKRVEQAQYEALHAATNNLKPSQKLIRLMDEEWVRQKPNGFRRYMFHLRYDLGMGLEGDQAYYPLMCFDLDHNSDEAVKKKQEDKVKLNGRCNPCELTYEELVERSHLLTLLTRTEHALKTHGEVPKMLSGNDVVSRRYKAVAAFETALLGESCTMSGEVLPDHIFDGHHRTEQCDLQEGDTVYSTAKVCKRDGLYKKCPKEYIPWRNRLFNEVLKKTRLKKEWHKVLHWVLRNLDWFASQGIAIDYPYKVDGTVLVRLDHSLNNVQQLQLGERSETKCETKRGKKRGTYKLDKRQQEADDIYLGINEINATEKYQSIDKIFSGTSSNNGSKAKPGTIRARWEVFKKRNKEDASYYLIARNRK